MRSGIIGNGKCRSGGIGRRPGLKIPWEYIPYRFEPGFRHQHQTIYRAVEQLVARRAHNPEVVGSSPARATKKRCQKRCTAENPRFSRVFFVFRRFSRFFKNQKTMRIKRCKTHFRDVGGDLNLRLPFFDAYKRRFSENSHRFCDILLLIFCVFPIFFQSNK